MTAASFFNNPIKLKRCTGLSIAQFQVLAQRMEPAWEQAEKNRLLHPQRKRAIGAGHPYGLKIFKEKLACVLMWYKVYPALWLLGMMVGIDASNVCMSLLSSRNLPCFLLFSEEALLPTIKISAILQRWSTFESL